jgi:hypothetical protein
VSNWGVVSMGEPLVVGTAVAGGLAMWIWKARRTQLATAVLCVFAGLTFGKSVLRERAEIAYVQHAARADASSEYLVEPVWASLWEWRIFDRTRDHVRAWTIKADGEMELFAAAPLSSGDQRRVVASMQWPTVRNFQRAHDFAFAVATDRGVEWSDVRYCNQSHPPHPPQCSLWAGGEFTTPPQLRHLVVRVGKLVQTRQPK